MFPLQNRRKQLEVVGGLETIDLTKWISHTRLENRFPRQIYSYDLRFYTLYMYYLICLYNFKGYCIDLAVLLQEECTTPYEYYIDLVGDNNYGAVLEEYGCWNGMIGELISDQGCPHGTRKVNVFGVLRTGMVIHFKNANAIYISFSISCSSLMQVLNLKIYKGQSDNA